MPLPSCICVAGRPPFDRLNDIFCALSQIDSEPVVITDILSVTINEDGRTADVKIENKGDGGFYDFGLGPNNNPVTGTPKVTFNLVSPSFTATGTVTTISRQVYAVQAERQAYPNQALNQETEVGADVIVRVALSEYIYPADTLTVSILAGFYTDGTGNLATSTHFPVTNNSAITDSDILSGWGWVPFERVSNSVTVERAAFHRFAQNGSPIRCAKLSATDGSLTSPVVTTTSMVQPTRGDIPIGTYEAALNLSTLANGVIYANAQEFPWVGSSSKTTVGGAVAPYLTDGPLPLYKGGTFVYAYVDVGAVGGAVSTVAATAKTTPFPTWSAAKNAIGVYNTANGTEGGEIVFMAGTHTLTDSGAAMTTLTWLIAKRDPDVGINAVIINDCANFPGAYLNVNLLCVRNLRIDYNKRLFQGTTAQAIWLDNCQLNQSGTTGVVYNWGVVYITNCTGSGGAILTGDAESRIQLARNNTGIKLTRSRCWIYNLDCDGAYFPDNALFDGGFIYGASKDNYDGSSVPWANSPAVDIVHGFALVLAQIEQTIGTGPTIALFGDSNTLSGKNLILWHNTIAGERNNMAYTDSATAVLDQWSVCYNALQWWPAKQDVFHTNGTFINGWGVLYETGCRGNHSEFGGTNICFDLRRIGLNSTYAPAQGSNSLAGYTDDASRFGTGLGNGNYYPTGASILRLKIAAGQSVIPFDLVGNAFSNTGGGTAGVFQRTQDP